MRRLRRLAIPTLCLCLLAAVGELSNAQGGVPRRHHPWGRFGKGAWRVARVATETLDDQGQVTQTTLTETKTTLEDVDDQGVTLKIQVVLEVAGKKIETEPQHVRQGFNGEPSSSSQVRTGGSEQLIIDGRPYPCEVQMVETIVSGRKTVTKTYYCDAVAPYVLRTESTLLDGAEENRLAQTVTELIALDLPFPILSRMRRTAHFKATQESPKGKSVSVVVQSVEVPGGIVFETTKEMDAQDRPIRQSTLELVSFGVPDEQSLADGDSAKSSKVGLLRLINRVITRPDHQPPSTAQRPADSDQQ